MCALPGVWQEAPARFFLLYFLGHFFKNQLWLMNEDPLLMDSGALGLCAQFAS